METVITREATPADAPVLCPICSQPNQASRLCRHVRWTFDLGSPVDFACFALETSPYVRARGHSGANIGTAWLDQHGDWIVDRVMVHFEAWGGFVFGHLGDLDLLARDIFKEFHPDPVRPQLHRFDPI